MFVYIRMAEEIPVLPRRCGLVAKQRQDTESEDESLIESVEEFEGFQPCDRNSSSNSEVEETPPPSKRRATEPAMSGKGKDGGNGRRESTARSRLCLLLHTICLGCANQPHLHTKDCFQKYHKAWINPLLDLWIWQTPIIPDVQIKDRVVIVIGLLWILDHKHCWWSWFEIFPLLLSMDRLMVMLEDGEKEKPDVYQDTAWWVNFGQSCFLFYICKVLASFSVYSVIYSLFY